MRLVVVLLEESQRFVGLVLGERDATIKKNLREVILTHHARELVSELDRLRNRGRSGCFINCHFRLLYRDLRTTQKRESLDRELAEALITQWLDLKRLDLLEPLVRIISRVRILRELAGVVEIFCALWVVRDHLIEQLTRADILCRWVDRVLDAGEECQGLDVELVAAARLERFGDIVECDDPGYIQLLELLDLLLWGLRLIERSAIQLDKEEQPLQAHALILRV